ncbi:hypothetical protein [Alkalihalobacterium bogoriense]|uniref:hypothetical protein n=1 Tax=Alkalihalobacterium bogoriense TaxID=246272 RepID=UPI0006883F5D|nr:hypothetical protein [Alkalihalobacterium bogoriense]
MSRDWLGDMIKDFEKKEGPLKGSGKPLPDHILKGDVLDRTIQHANYRPEWLALQHSICNDIQLFIKERPTLSRKEIQSKIETINKKIKKYNTLCPTPLQKMKVSKDTLEKQLSSWL